MRRLGAGREPGRGAGRSAGEEGGRLHRSCLPDHGGAQGVLDSALTPVISQNLTASFLSNCPMLIWYLIISGYLHYSVPHPLMPAFSQLGVYFEIYILEIIS